MKKLEHQPLEPISYSGLFYQAFKRAWDSVNSPKSEKDKDIFKMSLLNDFKLAANNFSDEILKSSINTMHILGMEKPRPLENIYVKVNILEKLSSSRKLSVEDLLEESLIEEYLKRDEASVSSQSKRINWYGRVSERKVNALSEINKGNNLIILGKPGAGKTTFLKYIAVQAAKGNLKNKAYRKVPIFISLKDMTDQGKSVLDYIEHIFENCGFPSINRKPFVEKILKNNDAIVLFDGLDEVNSDDVDKAISEIKTFCEDHSKNLFVISCRIAAFNYVFSGFESVEIADFDLEQIDSFIENYFSDEIVSQECFNEMQKNPRVMELARSPLLLTLLCINYDHAQEFSSNRAELYSEAIDALLKKWDSSRKIRRAEVYQGLSNPKKMRLFSEVAWKTFNCDQYFIKQKQLEQYIGEFLVNLPEFNEDKLDADSEDVLKAIEAQHGIFVERAKKIYSFSHLTFQEYFAANKIANDTVEQNRIINDHILEAKWKEVLLLISGLTSEADEFLLRLKARVDQILVSSRVRAVLEKVESLSTKYSASEAWGRAIILSDFLTHACSEYQVKYSSDNSLYPIIRKASYLAESIVTAKIHDIEMSLAPASKRKKTVTIEDAAHARKVFRDKVRAKQVDFNRDIEVGRISLLTSLNNQDFRELANYLYGTNLVIESLESDIILKRDTRLQLWDNVLLRSYNE